MRPTLTPLIAAAALSLGLSACHDVPEYQSDMLGNFDALWTAVDEHYCFFDQKGIDWNVVGQQYRAMIDDKTNVVQLFQICAGMLNTLRDGHVNLSSSFNTSYYREWWSDYPQDYDERLVQEHYLKFKYYSIGASYYYLIGDNEDIGYLRFASFSYPLGDTSLDYIYTLLSNSGCRGLIIDIRDNGGGDMTAVESMVSRFIDRRILAGYICHKTGRGHNDFSEPYAFYYDPAPQGRVRWDKSVVILTNRSTFSAANTFVAVMKHLPQVRIVGAPTGGGSGMPYTYELPNGWGVRMSACPVYDCDMLLTENGIAPSDGCEIGLDEDLARQGIDTMLERAMEVVNELAPPAEAPDTEGESASI